MPEESNTRNPKWNMGEPASNFTKFFNKHAQYIPLIKEFEEDVTSNPYGSQVRDRIVAIQREGRRYPEGSCRWRKSNVRIVYLPEKETRTVYPLDADTAGNIGYKKR